MSPKLFYKEYCTIQALSKQDSAKTAIEVCIYSNTLQIASPLTLQSQEKLGVTFSQTLFVLVLAFCFFTLCDTKTTPSSILLAILILKKL
jgi:hypothetical protein